MQDNNYNLEYSTPMNDVPTDEEVLTKKPDYDKILTPTPQTFDKGCQSKSLDDDNLQQGYQTIPSKNLLDSKTDNNNNYHRFICEQPPQEREEMEKSHKTALVLFIVLILFIVIDIILEVCGKLFTPFLLGDNIAIFIMAIVHVIFIILKKSIEDPCLVAVSFFVLLAGFAVKGVGFYLMNQNVEKPSNAAFGLFFLCFGKFALSIACLVLINKNMR